MQARGSEILTCRPHGRFVIALLSCGLLAFSAASPTWASGGGASEFSGVVVGAGVGQSGVSVELNGLGGNYSAVTGSDSVSFSGSNVASGLLQFSLAGSSNLDLSGSVTGQTLSVFPTAPLSVV